MKKTANKMGVTSLRRGDMVMIIAGGNKTNRPLKGQVGKLLRFVGKDRSRAIVEGMNLVTKHQRAKGPGQTAARVKKEAPIHVSRLMYYAEGLKKPVRLGHAVLADGTKVRGYRNPESGEFVQIAD